MFKIVKQNHQFLGHLIIEGVFIISTDFPREDKGERTDSTTTIRLLMKVTTIFVLPIPCFAMQSEISVFSRAVQA